MSHFGTPGSGRTSMRLHGFVCVLLLGMFGLMRPGWPATPSAPPPAELVMVAVTTDVNKIYQIDAIAESYTIDACLPDLVLERFTSCCAGACRDG